MTPAAVPSDDAVSLAGYELGPHRKWDWEFEVGSRSARSGRNRRGTIQLQSSLSVTPRRWCSVCGRANPKT